MERIIVKNLTKEFKIDRLKQPMFLQQLKNILLFSRTEHAKVLNDISFSLKSGEIIGLIGANGAGKTTLLRVLADIYPVYSGQKITHGKIIPLIDLGVSLNSRLILKDNIFMVGALFGLSSRQIKEKFSDIVNFAELEDFLEYKIYQLSTGQKERIAFSIAIHCEPDILLLDEVFAVGDEEFRNKSSAKIKQLVDAGASAIFTSHELSLVEQYCHRTIWLENGKIIEQGDTNQIIAHYKNANK
jgi:ABC-type polysaccharide/polyol phosphate transport system ATPase subunit